MGDGNRVVTYNGYEIRIVVLPPLTTERSFRAKYEVRSLGDHAQSLRAGVMAGDLETPQEAEEAALMAAKRMIDSGSSIQPRLGDSESHR